MCIRDRLVAVIHAFACITCNADQTISGTAINFLAPGIAIFICRVLFSDSTDTCLLYTSFLQLEPPKDIYEAINSLLIFYKNVPSVTNYPVYLGNIDELLEPFMDDVDEAQAKKLFKLFFTPVSYTHLFRRLR